MRKSIYALAAFGCLSMSPADALVVDFAPGHGWIKDFKVVNEYEATGTWKTKGFNVDWDYSSYWGSLNEETDPRSLGFSSLVDGCPSCADAGLSLTFGRSDGKGFSLRSFAVYDILSLYIERAYYTPFGADGNLDFAHAVSSTFIPSYANILLEGVKHSGQTVSLAVDTFADAAWVRTVTNDPLPWSAGDGLFDLDAAQQSVLSDLSSLKVTAVGPNFGNSLTWRNQGVAYPGVDPIFLQAPQDCTYSCTVAGLGSFYFEPIFLEAEGIASNITTLDSFTFDVSPAPVPVGGSAIFALSSLALLGGASAWLRRRSAA